MILFREVAPILSISPPSVPFPHPHPPNLKKRTPFFYLSACISFTFPINSPEKVTCSAVFCSSTAVTRKFSATGLLSLLFSWNCSHRSSSAAPDTAAHPFILQPRCASAFHVSGSPTFLPLLPHHLSVSLAPLPPPTLYNFVSLRFHPLPSSSSPSSWVVSLTLVHLTT